MIGIRWLALARRRCSSKPSMPGIFTSRMRHVISVRQPESRNSRPDAKASALTEAERADQPPRGVPHGGVVILPEAEENLLDLGPVGLRSPARHSQNTRSSDSIYCFTSADKDPSRPLISELAPILI